MQVVYFARIREAIGVDGEQVDVEAGATISALLDRMSAHSERHAAAFLDRDKLRFALDHNMVQADAILGSATELAIFPPVTGG